MLRKSITCISLLFIGCGISYFGMDYKEAFVDVNTNRVLVGKYFEKPKEKNNYTAVLEIPKLKFKRGLYDIDNPESEINKNIIFVDKSDMPDEDNSRVIIVGHSGAPSNAYFKDLYKLRKNDLIYLYYNDVKYIYQVSEIYDIMLDRLSKRIIEIRDNKNEY